MRAVGIEALKDHLSEYVRLAAGGETVLVTDRDRVVAELVPPQERRLPSVEYAVLVDLLRRGWYTPPAVRSPDPPPRAPVMRWDELAGQIAEDRDDR